MYTGAVLILIKAFDTVEGHLMTCYVAISQTDSKGFYLMVIFLIGALLLLVCLKDLFWVLYSLLCISMIY